MDADTLFRCTFQLEIIENVNLLALIPLLNRCELLTKQEEEQLLNKLFPSDERIMRLTEILSRKGPDCVSKFLDCLRQEKKHPGHAHLLQLIERRTGITPQCRLGECSVQKATRGESKMLESSSTAHEDDTPYRAMIIYLSRQLEALGVGTTEIRTAMQRLLPSRDLSILNSWTILDFTSLHSYLSDRQMCSPIEVDVILRLLFELEQHGLINQVHEYVESVRETSLVGTAHASPVMEDCLLLYVCYKNPAALKVESVWDEKHRLCEVLVAERHQFWFIGYEENPVITFVWQFPSTMFDSCAQRVQQQCTQLLQSDITSIRCLHLNRCNTLFDANGACPGPIVDSWAVKRPRIECPTPPLQSGDLDTPPPAKRKPPIVTERGRWNEIRNTFSCMSYRIFSVGVGNMLTLSGAMPH